MCCGLRVGAGGRARCSLLAACLLPALASLGGRGGLGLWVSQAPIPAEHLGLLGATGNMLISTLPAVLGATRPLSVSWGGWTWRGQVLPVGGSSSDPWSQRVRAVLSVVNVSGDRSWLNRQLSARTVSHPTSSSVTSIFQMRSQTRISAVSPGVPRRRHSSPSSFKGLPSGLSALPPAPLPDPLVLLQWLLLVCATGVPAACLPPAGPPPHLLLSLPRLSLCVFCVSLSPVGSAY